MNENTKKEELKVWLTESEVYWMLRPMEKHPDNFDGEEYVSIYAKLRSLKKQFDDRKGGE